MKKIVIIAMGAFLTFGMMSLTQVNTNKTVTEVSSSSFKLINDTGASVKLKHKGGSMTLNKGASTSISCTKSSNDIYIDGEKVHTVSSEDCGKSIKLSTWM